MAPTFSTAVLRFPFSDAGVSFSCDMPSTPDYGSTALTAGTGYTKRDTAFDNSENCAQRVPIPRGKNIVGVSIHPQSGFPACDIRLGGRTDEGCLYRISMGNPLFAKIDENTAVAVSLPWSAPVIDSTQGNDSLAWDATDMQGSALIGKFWGFPLRLQLWENEMPSFFPVIRNDEYARIRFSIAIGTQRQVTFLTEGRRKIRFFFNATNATASWSLAPIGNIKQTAKPNIDLTSTGPLLQALTLLPAGFSSAEVDVAGYMAVVLVISDTVGTAGNNHQVFAKITDRVNV